MKVLADTDLKMIGEGIMIRAVKQEDIKECVRVIVRSFMTVADEFGFTAFAAAESRLDWHMKGEHRPMYVYMEDDVIVGYYSLLQQENEECELNNVCVLPEYRHKGIGEQLMRHAFKIAEELGCKKVCIGIVEENTVLKEWYASQGFVHTGTLTPICP